MRALSLSMRSAVFVVVLAAFATLPARGASVLFPKPFHLVKEIDDSLSGRVVRIEEYFAGDRAITIRGEQTVIADYARQEMTVIDRAASTYSVTSFARLAGATTTTLRSAGGGEKRTERVSMTPNGSDRRAGRTVDLFSGDDPQASLHADVAIDPSVTLSRAAIDVVSGATFPASGGAAGELIRRAAARSAGGVAAQRMSTSGTSVTGEEERYGLPVEQILRWQSEGETIVLTSRVLSIDDALPPAELLTIPSGARLVESRRVQSMRAFADADALVPSHSEH